MNSGYADVNGIEVAVGDCAGLQSLQFHNLAGGAADHPQVPGRSAHQSAGRRSGRLAGRAGTGEDDILGVLSRAGNMQSRNRASFLLHSYLILCGRIAASRAVKESGDDSRW